MDLQTYKDYFKRNSATNWTSIWLRALEVWLVISVVEVIHGIARIAFLQPLVGDFHARQIAVFSGSVLILAVAFLFRGWTGAKTFWECLVVGTIWVLLTIGFEVFLGRNFMDLTWERILSDYDLRHGGLMLIGLTVMLFAPLIVSRLSTSKTLTSSSHIRTTRSADHQEGGV